MLTIIVVLGLVIVLLISLLVSHSNSHEKKMIERRKRNPRLMFIPKHGVSRWYEVSRRKGEKHLQFMPK